MKLINLQQEIVSRNFKKLMEEYAKELVNQKPTSNFKAISIYRNWQVNINEFLIKRLDTEVNKQKDLIIISDIKYNRCNQLYISYVSMSGIDYDDFIERLLINENS